MFRLSRCTAFLLAFSCSVFPADIVAPDLTLSGEITRADYQTYREVPFRVPEGVSQVRVEFSYTGKDQHTTIDLGLLDNERFRGWSGGNKTSFTVAETDATASFLPGPIRAGEWKLLLGIPNIREGVRSQFTALIFFSHPSQLPAVSTFSSAPIRTGPAWYRGDLHVHTAHSDASCHSQSGLEIPCPVFRTLEAAVARALDFIAVTDHNTTSQYDAMRELQPYFDRLLLIPGREITTFFGHANVFGTTSFIDFRLTSPHVPAINALLKQVEDVHALISLNHPGAPSAEFCMGCGWTAPNTDFTKVQAIEAINGGAIEGKYSGVPFWESQLNKGFRITGIGGSDNHNAEDAPKEISSVGHPTTVVFAEDLSERAILKAIRAGHVFIDTVGTRDRLLELSAKSSTGAAVAGDNLSAPNRTSVNFSIHVSRANGAHIEIVEDGQPSTVLAKSTIKKDDDTEAFNLVSDGTRHWVQVNVRSADGHLLLVSNPVYLNF